MNPLDLLLDSMRRNAAVNAALFGSLTPAELDASDGRGGWSIGQTLAHMAAFRPGWLSRVSPAHAGGIPDVCGEKDDAPLLLGGVPELERAFSVGDEHAVRAVQDAIAEGRSFEGAYESHPAHFLQHIIVHDSHHRGQIMSLLRLNGRSAEALDEFDGVMWRPWKE